MFRLYAFTLPGKTQKDMTTEPLSQSPGDTGTRTPDLWPQLRALIRQTLSTYPERTPPSHTTEGCV